MRKLATAALSFSSAVYLAHFLLPMGYWLYGAAAFFLLSVALGAFLKGDMRLRGLLITLSACLGLLICLGSYKIRNAPAAELTDWEGKISAEVTDFPREFPDYGYSTVEVRLKTEGLPGLKTKLYSYDYSISSFSPGDMISTVGRFRAADTRAGEKYDRYNADGIYLLCTATAEPKVTERGKTAFFYFPRRLARAIEESAGRVFAQDTAPLLTALLTGNKELLYKQEQLYANMATVGILHVVAVSGMHVAFLAGFVQSLIRKKSLSALISIVIVWLFVPMAGATPSVVRAAFMLTTALIAPIMHRENDGITSLSAILALLLFINPDACASVSLQLSFAAMLGIIVFTPRVYKRLMGKYFKVDTSKGHKALRLLSGLGIGALASLSSTLGAMVISTPFAALHFGYTSLSGILVNILIFWVISLCFTMGYVACLLGLVWLPLGRLLGAGVSCLTRLIILAVDAAAKVPYGAVFTEDTAFGWWLVLVYIIFSICFMFRRKKGFRPIIPLCLSICSLCSIIIFSELGRVYQPPKLTVLDVGQGQSIVAVNKGATIVIDCGGKNGARNAGELAAAELLGQGRRSLDLLALTHLDDDHVNGVTRLMSRVDVKALVLPAYMQDIKGGQKIIDFAGERGTEVYIISEDTQFETGDMTLRVYGSNNIKKPQLMYLWSEGENDVLITGDGSYSDERLFLKTHSLPHLEVYIVGHHGSKHSSSKELLSAIDAKWAVISCGYNHFGHPAPETLQRLGAAGMEILRTDQLGDITLKME